MTKKKKAGAATPTKKISDALRQAAVARSRIAAANERRRKAAAFAKKKGWTPVVPCPEKKTPPKKEPKELKLEVPAEWLEKVVKASYSADRIPDGKTRKPFTWADVRWVSVGGISGGGLLSEHVYRVVCRKNFSGKVTTYWDKGSVDQFESARNDPNGFYHGMAVNLNDVLCGPEVWLVGGKIKTLPSPPDVEAAAPVTDLGPNEKYPFAIKIAAENGFQYERFTTAKVRDRRMAMLKKSEKCSPVDYKAKPVPPPIPAESDPSYQRKLDGARLTAEFNTKSRRRLDAGRKPITESPLWGDEAQGRLF